MSEKTTQNSCNDSDNDSETPSGFSFTNNFNELETQNTTFSTNTSFFVANNVERDILNNLLALVHLQANVNQFNVLPKDGKKEGTADTVSLPERLANVSEYDVTITPPATPPVVLYSAPPVHGAPPTYSAIMRLGPVETQPRSIFSRREVRMQPSPPFIAPTPPPTYSETQGDVMADQRPFIRQVDAHESFWGMEPLPTICPVCGNFIITVVHTRRSNLTHFSALALCICGCWPCCLLPYCMKSCKTTYHECPLCHSLIAIAGNNQWFDL